MKKRSIHSGAKHRRRTVASALRYGFGAALVVAGLVGGAPPALATGVDITATCDRWHVQLDGYTPKATKTVTLRLDLVVLFAEVPFANGFNLSGPWETYRETHIIRVDVWIDGAHSFDFKQAFNCPTSAPPTTVPPTTAPPTTTAPVPAPATTQPTPSTTIAETSETPATTTTAPALSTTSTLAITTLESSTTVDFGTAEAGPTDSALAAADTEPPSDSSNTAPLLIGLLAIIVLAGVGGGAWYFGRRSTQN